MYRWKLIVMLAAAATLLSGAVILAQGEQESAFGFLRPEDYTAAGLGKLDYDEQARLSELLLHNPLPSYCEESADAFMREQGWRQVRVIGGYREKDYPNELRLFLQADYTTFILDPTIAPAVLEPGVYWGKNVGRQWTLLSPDGRQGSYSAMDRH
jgi:hypothetical protein